MRQKDHHKVEAFYDVLFETTSKLVVHLKLPYFKALSLSVDYLLEGEVINDDLSPEIINEMNALYRQLDQSFEREEIRRAFQLCLLQGLKHENESLSMITPDSIGLLFAVIINAIYKEDKLLNILDASVGSGNLLFTVLNHTNLKVDKLFGVDPSYLMLEVALALAELLNYNIEFIHQDARNPLVVPALDLVIADLPDDFNDPELPYRIVQNLIQYVASGGYFVFLIPNDFFTRTGNDKMREIILNETFMQGLIALPEDLFQSAEVQKSILILQKRGEQVEITKDILVFNFPSFQDQEAVKQAIVKLQSWFNRAQD